MDWISVKERLPNVNKAPKQQCEWVTVIACIAGRCTVSRMYERANIRGKVVCRWLYPEGAISYEDITHWMPLPEPPKEEKKA